DFLHRKPGKGNTIMNVTLKDVVNGGVIEKRFNIGEKLEDVRVERRPYQYLYKDGEDLVFMNNETFEQINIHPSLVNGVNFLKESENVEVVVDSSTETVLYADVPVKVHLQITWTEPGLKGDTATNTLKPARVETGAEIRVPLFIEEGEIVEVDSRDGSYLGRVKA
ncbi:MAG: elongation factor P, partial [Lachnospiraceae bacterium]|nr:elongation factor P [Lachnospiraceae bacterium]